MGCNDCNECNDCTDPCLEECGCDIEITSLACVRHDGEDFPCIEVVKGDSLEAIIQKINDKICEALPGNDGEDGADGQGIDHVSYTPSSVGDVPGQPGQTDTYTMWGDVAETINLGIFIVYNGIDGVGIDHVSFTSTTGPEVGAGESGQTDTYTMWADAGETISLGTFVVYNGTDGLDSYDSGWIDLNDYNSTYGFGLPAYTDGWSHPKIRVCGKIVFLEGYLMLPLSSSPSGSVLVEDVSTYPTDQKGEVQIYTGAAGGYDLTSSSVMKTESPILPSALTPSTKHYMGEFEISYRNVLSNNSLYGMTLTTLFSNTFLHEDGKFEINTLQEIEKGTPGVGSYVKNAPPNKIVSKTIIDHLAPNYIPYYTEYDPISGDERISPSTQVPFPSNFDGNSVRELGGFRAKFTTSYPLGEGITQSQIEEAIEQIQE